jgi:hypothetical protein
MTTNVLTRFPKIIRVTIAASAALSAIAEIGDNRIAAIVMPATWTTANLTFQASIDGTDFFDVYDEAGAEYSVTAGASRYIGLDAGALELSAINYIKVRSGTTGSPVNQGAAREIILVTG